VFSIALAGPASQSQGCGKRGHTQQKKDGGSTIPRTISAIAF